MSKKIKVLTGENALNYKGYSGTVTCDLEENMLFGKVLGINDMIVYQGNSIEELKEDFISAIDTYIDFCKEEGKKPEKPFSGKMLVRVSPELHGQIAIRAQSCGKSMNEFIAETLTDAISSTHCHQ